MGVYLRFLFAAAPAVMWPSSTCSHFTQRCTALSLPFMSVRVLHQHPPHVLLALYAPSVLLHVPPWHTFFERAPFDEYGFSARAVRLPPLST